MSPIGGVGINLAIQDAVAAANLLAKPLLERRLTTGHLRQVQKRREVPTRVTQRLQVLIQQRVITRILGGAGQLSRPLALRLLARFPFMRRLPARLFGIAGSAGQSKPKDVHGCAQFLNLKAGFLSDH